MPTPEANEMGQDPTTRLARRTGPATLMTLLEDLAGVGHWSWNVATGEVQWSDELYRIHGRDPAVFQPHNTEVGELMLAADAHAVRGALSKSRQARQPFDVVYRAMRPDGETRWVHARGTVRLDASGEPTHQEAFVRDITDDNPTYDRARFRRGVDLLTGLPTREELLARLEVAPAPDGNGDMLLLCEVLGFRKLNEEFGIQACDARLRRFAGRLTEIAGDGFVARIGADSFALVVPGEMTEETQAAARIAAAWQMGWDSAQGSETCVVSLTPALPGTDDARRWLARAELELGVAHDAARAHHPVTETVARRGSGIDAESLLAAMAAGELHLAYQPKVELVTRRVVGFEALARWTHPSRGPISPVEFIPVAEATGTIHQLGAWALRSACDTLVAWHKTALTNPLPGVSVNVSPVQFDEALVPMVAACIRDSGVDPSFLTLEVTESTVMRDPDAATQTLLNLRELGVKISVDDFGTGHSSLSNLRALPVDQLKIDRSFVTGLGTDHDATSICAAIVALAHSLDLDIVAEGIESEGQASELRRLGCEYGQGYLYSPPVAAADVPALVADLGGVVMLDGPDGFQEVLVVDDAKDVRQLATLSLQADGFAVTSVATGREGIDAAIRLQPQVIVLDVSLPDIPGYEVCRRIRATPAGAAATILMLTSHNETSVKIEAYAAGADDYMVKPFSPRDLVSRVKEALARRDVEPAMQQMAGEV